MNSHDVIHGTEAFAAPQDLVHWLSEHGVLADATAARSADEKDLDLAVRLREALRSLLIANAGDAPLDDEAVATVNQAAELARLTTRLDAAGRPTLQTAAPGVPGALGRIVGLALAAMTDGSWRRLKACHAEDCRWIFYDRSKSGRGVWCETSATGCGARAKMRAYRGRSEHERA